MDNKTGKIIISKNIKLDKEYKHVLSYNETEMQNLLLANKVYEANECSFFRDTNKLLLDITYTQAIQCNYLGFENPDYSNKWFFAFIDSVEYYSQKSTLIHITIDEWSTWFDYWNPADTFVVREHVTNDSIGANTVPENIELGEFIINKSEPIEYSKLSLLSNMNIIVGISKEIVARVGENASVALTSGKRIYGGIYSGLYYLAFRNPENVTNFLNAIDKAGFGDNVYSVFIVPSSLVKVTSWITAELENLTFEFAVVPDSNNAINIKAGEEQSYVNIPINNTLDGYTPINNKLYTAPFNYLTITNNVGSEAIYRYEDFTNNEAKFKIVGTISVGASIKLLPYDYKKIDGDVDANSASLYGLNASKYPTCSWQSDSYTNWLTQNSVNFGLQYAQNAFNLVANVATENYMGAVGSGFAIANQVASVYQASFLPTQAKGNINSGDIAYSGGMMGFRYLQMSVRNEYAKIIDDYFTCHGYQVNRLKKPNIKTRKTFNYLAISNESVLGFGSVPKDAMNTINRIARNGVTIWHNHATFGDYDQDNTNIN